MKIIGTPMVNLYNVGDINLGKYLWGPREQEEYVWGVRKKYRDHR